jgi:ubiquinone/menaquinone biosynthesis C-methylase UbiE
MFKLSKFIKAADLKFVKSKEKVFLQHIFKKYNGFPDLENIWKIMDEIWEQLDCDNNKIDFRIDSFYSHPIWLLNGLFIEQHKESMCNRAAFTKWVCAQRPNRVADYAGGFGTLARMIAKSCPNAEIEIIEPHFHQLAFEKTKHYKNISYKKKLTGKYDILIATDVFEHVPDPLALINETSISLKDKGKYLIANCFLPVLKCHLPQHYHFSPTFDHTLETAGLKITESVKYATVFSLSRKFNLKQARIFEKKSKKFWNLTKYLPKFVARRLIKFLINFL